MWCSVHIFRYLSHSRCISCTVRNLRCLIWQNPTTWQTSCLTKILNLTKIFLARVQSSLSMKVVYWQARLHKQTSHWSTFWQAHRVAIEKKNLEEEKKYLDLLKFRHGLRPWELATFLVFQKMGPRQANILSCSSNKKFWFILPNLPHLFGLPINAKQALQSIFLVSAWYFDANQLSWFHCSQRAAQPEHILLTISKDSPNSRKCWAIICVLRNSTWIYSCHEARPSAVHVGVQRRHVLSNSLRVRLPCSLYAMRKLTHKEGYPWLDGQMHSVNQDGIDLSKTRLNPCFASVANFRHLRSQHVHLAVVPVPTYPSDAPVLRAK
jgi:hypothetical protein